MARAARPRTSDACCGRQRHLDGCLLLDGLDNGRVLVADVGVDQLAGEVQERVALEVPDPAALAGCEHAGLQGALGAPRMEDMGAVEVVSLGIAAFCRVAVRFPWSLMAKSYGNRMRGEKSHFGSAAPACALPHGRGDPCDAVVVGSCSPGDDRQLALR